MRVCGTFWSVVLRPRCIYQRSSIIFQKSTLEQGPLSKAQSHFFKIVVNFLRSIIPSLFGRGWGIFHNAFLPKIQTLYFARTFFIITFYQKSKLRSKLFLIKAFNFLFFRRSHFFTFEEPFQDQPLTLLSKSTKTLPHPL